MGIHTKYQLLPTTYTQRKQSKAMFYVNIICPLVEVIPRFFSGSGTKCKIKIPHHRPQALNRCANLRP